MSLFSGINIINSIICSTFENEVGRWQAKVDKKTGMKITFRLKTEYEVEEGYRNLEVLIYSEFNYVAVAVRELWTVIPLDELEYEDGEPYIKESSIGYRKGDTGWKLASYHYSCWREGIQEILRDNNDRILGIDTLFIKGWYQKIEMDSDLLDTLEKLIDDRKSNYYKKLLQKSRRKQ